MREQDCQGDVFSFVLTWKKRSTPRCRPSVAFCCAETTKSLSREACFPAVTRLGESEGRKEAVEYGTFILEPLKVLTIVGIILRRCRSVDKCISDLLMNLRESCLLILVIASLALSDCQQTYR